MSKQASNKSPNNVVIVGASHAAAETVAQLRKQGWEHGITVIGDEPQLPYQRPPLSKAYFNGDVDSAKLLIRPEEYYEKLNVSLRLGERVAKLDTHSNTLLLENGDAINYSKSVLATGTRARLLPIEGADADNVLYLRTLDDVDNIRSRIGEQSNLLIVGAGYIGLEIAASAVKQGVKVTVLEAQDRVLARVTSPEISEFYQRIHAEEGVDIRLGVGLAVFEHSANAGSYALLANGERVAFDNVIVGIGVVPNTELAAEAGLECDNGIVVDEYTRTNHADVFAIGDCSNHPNLLYQRRIRLESVPNAAEQAKVAAASICGTPVVYDAVPWFWSDQYDVKLQTVGLLEGYDQAVVRGDTTSRKFSVFYLQRGRVLAIDAVNSPAEFMIGKKMVAAQQELTAEAIADTQISVKALLQA